jgi:hypothetical protein
MQLRRSDGAFFYEQAFDETFINASADAGEGQRKVSEGSPKTLPRTIEATSR